MSARRRTIASAATLEGIGLHLGHPCRLTFRPAPAQSGIRFRRTDRPGAPTIEALAERAVLTERRTQLGDGDEAVHTVEHVLSAVAGIGVHDLTIEMDAPEPPILDGSAAPFVTALRRAGVVDHGPAVQYLRLDRAVTLRDGESWYEAHPADALTLDVSIEFAHPLIGRQAGHYDVTPDAYVRELAPARTFGFVHEVEMLRAKGLIRGASVENAVVLDQRGVVGTTLRWPDEFVRHKAMDVVGDLALAGAPVCARIVAEKPSHRGTVLLVREIMRATPRRREWPVSMIS